MSLADLQVTRGLPSGYEAQAAALYWQAFGGKLGKLLGPSDRANDFFARTINHDAVLVAMQGDTLLGLAGFKIGKHGFSNAGVSDLFRHYGIGAFWRLVPLSMLERSARRGTLQMDGICVSRAARGQGIGAALLESLFDLARQTGHRRIALDVIDTNPRARALYERLGFVAVKQEDTGFLQPLLGFRTATRMERSV